MAKHISLFKRTKQLESKIKTFLMNIITASVIFNEATDVFLKKQANRTFLSLKNKIQNLESENDMLRREIESELYRQMILPGMRSDILELIEACDHVINQYEKVVIVWAIEKVKVPADLFEETLKLSEATGECVSALMAGVNAFFDGQVSVEEEVQRCYYLEHVVDTLAQDLQEAFFNKKLPLARQLQLRDFVNASEKISNLAEDAADKLKIISVKHAL